MQFTGKRLPLKGSIFTGFGYNNNMHYAVDTLEYNLNNYSSLTHNIISTRGDKNAR